MALLTFVLFLLAPCIGSGAVFKAATKKSLRHQVQGELQHTTGETLGKGCLVGRTTCTENNVSVLTTKTRDGRSKRELQFGDECATETTVICKSTKDCDSSCDMCACDFDETAELSTHYMQTMFQQLGPWCSDVDTKVLLIGLGGGEFPQYLLHHCPGMHIEAVELNGDVISMARKFFGVREAETRFVERFSIQQADALEAVAQRAVLNSNSYDAVLVDCFAGGGEVPESCRSRFFAEKVRDILKPKGALLQNIWHYSKMREQVQEEFKQTKTTYSDVFRGALDDLDVPMPPAIRWVDILKATKTL